MKTRLFLLTIAILFAIASPNVFGQSADNPETVKYSIGSYAPKGDFGAYLEEVEIGFYLVPGTVPYDANADLAKPRPYDRLLFDVKLWKAPVKKYRYNGTDYTDLCGISFQGYTKFKIQVAISGVGTKTIMVDVEGKYDYEIPLGRLYKEEELSQLKVTSFKLIEMYPRESERKNVAHCVDKQNGKQDAASNNVSSGSRNNGTAGNQTNRSNTERNTNSSNTNNPYMEQVAAYNEKVQADSKALDAAADQTIDGWANAMQQGKNADFITPSKSLVQEFASQGNAAGAYGTVGVAVGAQLVSILGSGKSEAKQIEEARRAEENQIREAYRSGDVKKSLELCANFIKNYEHYPPVYFETASILRKGGNGVEKDVNNAFLLAEKAVEGIKNSSNLKKYYPQAFYLLGLMYYTGEGTEQNYEKAFECFKEAERRDWYFSVPIGLNSCSPSTFVGFMTFAGLGTSKDEAKGLKTLKNDYGQGHYVLGRIYYEGLGGVSKDLEQAKKYLTKAVKSFYNPNPEFRAIEFLEKMNKTGELGNDAAKIMKSCRKEKPTARLSEEIEAIFFDGQKPILEDDLISFTTKHLMGNGNRIVGEVKNNEVNKIVDGKLRKQFITRHKNGNVSTEGMLEGNNPIGEWHNYYENGNIKSVYTFKDRQLDGEWKHYYENGKLKETGMFKAGEKVGEWHYYDKNGNEILDKN